MNPPLRALTITCLLLGGCSIEARRPPPRETLIRNVRAFDGAAFVERTDVLLRGDRIAEIGARLAASAGVHTVDGAGKTLLPGLIDAHFHICYGEQLEEALAAGITTVLDMGSDPAVGRRLKQELLGPGARRMADLRVAGNAVTVPGGYGTEKGVPIETLRSKDEADAFVEARVREGSDHVKILLDDGSAFGHRIPTLDRATMEAVLAATHRRRLVAVAHVSTQKDARAAIEAGVDGLAHIFFDGPPDEDFATLARAKGVFVVPTLTVGRGAGRAHARNAVLRLRDAGVPLLAGADDSNVALTQEVSLLVDAGLTPAEALAAATSLPAKHFGLADRGRIAPGMRADLLLVDGNPAEDIAVLRRPVCVWKQGEVVDRDAATAAFAARRRDGRVSDFEDEGVSAKFGGWKFLTDSESGGVSTAALRRSSPGAGGSRGALEVSGEIRKGKSPRAYAGAVFTPGTGPDASADLSSKKELVFRARGAGRFAAGVFSGRRGRAPALVPFTPGPEWTEIRIPLRSFQGCDGRDMTGVFFGVIDAPGTFRLELDDVSFQ